MIGGMGNEMNSKQTTQIPPDLKVEMDEYCERPEVTTQGLMKIITVYVLRKNILEPLLNEYEKDLEGFFEKYIDEER